METITLEKINRTKTETTPQKASFKERLKAYMCEVAGVVGPGYFMMNGSYYRPAGK